MTCPECHGILCSSCTDINECAVNNGTCQHICRNTGGSFSCSCRSGYRLGSNDRSCTGEEDKDTLVVIDINSVMLISSDINECAEDSDNCEQLCSNNAGSFTCSCRSGYLLASDGRSCIGEYIILHQLMSMLGTYMFFPLSDIDECTMNRDNCQQTCTNTRGSFTCGCESGYRLNSDGRTCRGR